MLQPFGRWPYFASLTIFLLGLGTAHGQEVRPFVVDPNAAAAAFVPLEARLGYYPLYSPVYNRAYFAAWAQAYEPSIGLQGPVFFDRRTDYTAPDYAAYYYTSRYYRSKYARYIWYTSPAPSR